MNNIFEEERDLVRMLDEDGNEVVLEVIEYFDLDDEEYAILIDAEDDECDCGCEHDHEHDEDEEHHHDHTAYIMKVVSSGETDDDGNELVEFVQPDESKMESLINAAQEVLFGDEEDDECDDEDCDCHHHHE